MALTLYAHPFSSYCQKVLIALYENATPFKLAMLGPETPENGAELARIWPLTRFPVLVDDGHPVLESSIIIEHLALHHPGPVLLLPANPAAALPVRMMDRIFDTYVMTPMQRIVGDSMRPASNRDTTGVAEARALLQKSFGWLDAQLAGRTWAAGQDFSMADCAAAPALFYADWVEPISDRFIGLRAYRTRLLARPSAMRAVDEARPYRPLFPLGAPDRD